MKNYTKKKLWNLLHLQLNNLKVSKSWVKYKADETEPKQSLVDKYDISENFFYYYLYCFPPHQ